MAHNHNGSPSKTSLSAHPDEALDTIRQALNTLKYGAIALTIHDAKVVQIEVTEKRRFFP
jgi:hypothetical protein